MGACEDELNRRRLKFKAQEFLIIEGVYGYSDHTREYFIIDSSMHGSGRFLNYQPHLKLDSLAQLRSLCDEAEYSITKDTEKERICTWTFRNNSIGEKVMFVPKGVISAKDDDGDDDDDGSSGGRFPPYVF